MFNVTKVNWQAKGVNYSARFDGHLNLLQVRDKLVSPSRPREQRCGMDGIKTIIHIAPGVGDKVVYGMIVIPRPQTPYLKRKEKHGMGLVEIAKLA